MRKEHLPPTREAFFLARGSLDLLVIITIHSLSAVVSLPLQLFLKQQLVIESKHDEKRFDQMMSR